MESPLEVLSRAATMVQDNANDTKISNKELPTTKWRRDRRLRTSSEYHLQSQQQQSQQHQQQHQMSILSTTASLTTTTNTGTSASSIISVKSPSELNCMINNGMITETPLDMTLTTKPRSSPPPPYREPLPGSTFVTSTRPSVITQAPKRDSVGSDMEAESISMCDPVIDEHFRRSLGDDYMILFNKNNIKTESSKIPMISSPVQSPVSSPISSPSPSPSPIPLTITTTTTTPTNNNKKSTTIVTDAIELSVDDHFAKALGDTWKKLQEENKPQININNNNKKDTLRPCAVNQVI